MKETGIDVHGFGHALDGSGVHHILGRHGENGTALKDFPNQIPLTTEDFKQLPDILANPDSIELGEQSDNGNERLILKKKINGHFITIEEVRDRYGKLIPVTMRKESVQNKNGAISLNVQNAAHSKWDGKCYSAL